MAQIEEQKMKNGQENPFDFIESCDTAALCRVLEQEDPLMISLLLGSLSLHKAAAVLQELPERLWLPVIEGLAQGNWESADTVECLAADIRNKIEQHTHAPSLKLGGIDFLEKVMESANDILTEDMLTLLREINLPAYTALKKHIFLFEDMLQLEDRSIKKLLAEVNMWELARALKTASPALQAKIEGNMSARAGAMLREEMEFMHPISSRDVKEAQQKIVWTLRRLADGGEVVLP